MNHMIDMIFYVTKNDIWNGLKINYYSVSCLKVSNNFIWNKKIIYFYNVSRLIIVLFFINSSSRILNWSISFCRCMLSSKHGIVIVLNLSNFIFSQFWSEIFKGSILNLAISSKNKMFMIVGTLFGCVCMTKLQRHKLFPPIEQSQMLLKTHSNFLQNHQVAVPDCQFIDFNSSELNIWLNTHNCFDIF